MRSATCETCAKTFEVEDRFAGLYVRCPRCGAVGRQPIGTAADIEARAISASGTLFVVPNHRAGPNDSTRLNLATLGESTRLATPTLSKLPGGTRPPPARAVPESANGRRGPVPGPKPATDAAISPPGKPVVKFNDTTVPVLKRVAARAGQDDVLAQTVEIRHGSRAVVAAILIGVAVGAPLAAWVLSLTEVPAPTTKPAMTQPTTVPPAAR